MHPKIALIGLDRILFLELVWNTAASHINAINVVVVVGCKSDTDFFLARFPGIVCVSE